MSVSLQDVELVASLARLRLESGEKEKLTRQLSRILKYMAKLNELDTEDIQPLSHPLNLKNVFRNDKIQASLPVKKVLENAPLKDENFFRVPQVVKK